MIIIMQFCNLFKLANNISVHFEVILRLIGTSIIQNFIALVLTIVLGIL